MAVTNILSAQPPLTIPLVDSDRRISKPWQQYFPLLDAAVRTTTSPPTITKVSDTSTVVAGLAQFYNPTYFGNAATGIISQFNRIQVGEAALTSGDVVSPTSLASTPSWADTLIGVQFIGLGQVSSVGAWGNSAFSGACRTSDYFNAWGLSSGGTTGANLLGYNDDPHGHIALGANIFGIKKSGVGGVTLGAQIDIGQAGATTDIDPQGTITNGVTIGALVTAGAYPGSALTNPSAGILISQGNTVHNPKFRRGIVIQDVALDTSLGAGGGGIAIDMGRAASIRVTNSGAADTEMWGNSFGLNINSQVNVIGGYLGVGNNTTGANGALNLFGSTSGVVSIFTSVTGNLCVVSQPLQLGQTGGLTGVLGIAGGTSGQVQLTTDAVSTGILRFLSSGSFTSPGATAATIPNSPGAATPQTYLTIKDSGGTVRYIPCL